MKTIEESVYNQTLNQIKNLKSRRNVLNKETCSQILNEIQDIFDEYEVNCKLQDQLRHDLCSKVHKFRQTLRKAHKKFRKGSSNLNTDQDDDDEVFEDFEMIVNYLDCINDFIKTKISSEYSDYQILVNG